MRWNPKSVVAVAVVAATPILGAVHARSLGAKLPVAPPKPGAGFEAFAPAVKMRVDGKWVRVESNGFPDHELMTGIRTWQQQVPLPQDYTGDNAWSIPVKPVPAAEPMSAKNHFLRGAIALAANGVPIFNALNNRGVDSFRAGELDAFGGHSGRADDYHYHTAPLHLQANVGPRNPIAWALDGYPLYGENEPDGTPRGKLDEFNGHSTAELGYHYHGTKTYPYINGGFHGEVQEIEGQVDPQPRASGVRPDTPPLPGARIVGFECKGNNSFTLRYTVEGKPAKIDYRILPDRTIVFDYQYSDGTQEQQTYRPRGQRPGGGRQGGGQGGGQAGRQPQESAPPQGDRPAENRGAASRGARRTPDPEIVAPKPADFQLSIPGTQRGGSLPLDTTCDGAGTAPALAWKNAPAGTQSFALAVHHQPPGDEAPHVYWVLTGIPATTSERKAADTSIGKAGANTVKRQPGYAPPCSQGPGKKWYTFTLYALSANLEFPQSALTRDQLLKAIDGKVLGTAVLHLSHTRTSGDR